MSFSPSLPPPAACGRMAAEGGDTMRNEIVEKLALIYVQVHTDLETTPAQMYGLYKKATQGIRDAEKENISHSMTV